jgi:DNA helicase-2/ATP-dependent DNA helicase PcrA
METGQKDKDQIFNEKYSKLNTAQKDAVDSIEGPVMVVAGPGTGKTTLLTLRIANILRQTDVNPENILALTFTNSGVFAMRKKLLEIIGDDAYRVGIFTFHSFAENIIKDFGFYFENFENKKVVDDLVKVKILEDIISENKFKEVVSFYDEFSGVSNIMRAIDSIKKEGLDSEEFKKRIPQWRDELLSDDNIYYKKKYREFNEGDIKPSEEKKIDKKVHRAKEIAQIFELYQEKMNERGLYDFHDMILLVIDQLEKNYDLKFDLQEKYQYILVDEHQDTNEGQNKIVELLTDSEHLDGRANIFTVGDEKQSIYRFQGASEKTFKHFHEIYRDIKEISLDQNYRSVSPILDSSDNLIKHNPESTESIKLQSNIKTDSNNPHPIIIAEFSNYKFELLYLAEQIKKQIADGVDPNEIAIIYRANKHIDEIKNILSLYGIPFTISSKDNILNDYEIGSLINLLRVIKNHNDDASLGKVLLIDFLNFDSFDVLKVLNAHGRMRRDKKNNLFEILQNNEILSEINITKESQDKFVELTEKIKSLKILSENTEFLGFFKDFLNEIGYIEKVVSKENKNSISEIIKLDKIFDEIKRQEQIKAKYNLSDFIDFIDSYLKYNLEIKSSDPEVLDGVKLMTAHGSKGLEFEYVYILNATRKNWENKKSGFSYSLPINDYKGTLEDERRLFYVGLTRAKKQAIITSSKTDWEGKEQDKSQFINELGERVFVSETEEFEKNNLSKIFKFLQNSKQEKSIWDEKYLSKIFLDRGLNVTALNNYLSCPIKYLFKNLIQLPSDYPSHMIYGTLAHSALQKFFNESKKQQQILDKKVLLDFYREDVKNSQLNDRDYEKYLEKGINTLDEYYDKYSSEMIFNVDTEQKIKKQFELNTGDEIKLSGDIDKIEYLDSELEGKINLIDYKTGKTFSEKSSKEQKMDLERQIVFYHLLLEGYKNDSFVINEALLDFIEKSEKTGNFERKTVGVTSDQVNELKNQIQEVASEILSGEFLKKGCEKKDCEYCALKIN